MAELYSWQQSLWQQLTKNHHLPSHAILLKGKQGIGKYDFARNLSQWLLCTHPTDNQQACGQCDSCNWFAQNNHPNFYQIEPEALTESVEASSQSNTSSKAKKKPSVQINIGQIRQLSDFVNLSGHQSGYKIILIHPAESMNLAAANALLKKLEEPPSQVLFILVSHRPQQLLPTIRSRCQQIVMPVPDTATALNWLKQQNISQPETALAAAGYAPLQAATADSTEYNTQHEQFISQLSAPAAFDPITLAQTMQHWELPTIVDWQQKWCYDLLSYYTTGKIRYHLAQTKTIQHLASKINPKELVTYSRHLIKTQQHSRHPLNARLFLEEMLIAYAQILKV